jgi:hypothetical protein
MKRYQKITVIIFLSAVYLVAVYKCKKEKDNDPTQPILTTDVVTGITQTGAISGGNITSDGGAPVTSRGVCWSITQNPNTGCTKTSEGTGTGSFTSNITGLTPNTTYYVRAYAINNAGTGYGNQTSFNSSPIELASLTTTQISDVTSSSAVSGGDIISDGGAAITERGVCWNTTSDPTAENSKTSDGTGTGSFSSSLTGLIPNTTYYVRAYATNSVGPAYGNELSFTSAAVISSLSTTDITDITKESALSGGNISSDGGSPVIERGVCWSTSSDPSVTDSHTSDGTGTGSFTSNITGLTSFTKYYVRAFATNSIGTAYGNEVSFTSKRMITCTAGCSTMSWSIEGESFGSIYYTNWTCNYTYVGSSYIKSCEGTWTFTASGNSYYIKVIYNWPECSITLEVEGLGTCYDKVGTPKSQNECNCDEKIDPVHIEYFQEQ